MSRSYEKYDQGISNGTIPAVPIPEIERDKYRLTQMADRAVAKGDYAEACRLKRELAAICHSQDKDGDAYQLMHDAFCMSKGGFTNKQISPSRLFPCCHMRKN